MFTIIKRTLADFRCVNYESSEFREKIASILRDYLSDKWETATSNNLIIKELKGGMSNSVFHITLPYIHPNEVKNEPRQVIMRFHQPIQNHYLYEHVAESLAFTLLSEQKFGPKLLAVFPGGRIEEFIDARPLKTEELRDRKFSLAVAEKMAFVHSMSLPLAKKNGIMFDLMEKWLIKIKKECTNWKTDTLDVEQCIKYFNQLDLTEEINWLRDFLINKDSFTCFCHNDLQEGNILVISKSEKEKPEIVFIDYEYSFYNYRGFELANHFLEYTMNYETKNYPYFAVNKNEYPSQEEQLLFFRRYLTVSKYLRQMNAENKKSSILNNSTIDFSELEDETNTGEMENKLLDETSRFRLASHLFWGIWAAVRSQSKISFGYWEYCTARLKAFYKIKEELNL